MHSDAPASTRHLDLGCGDVPRNPYGCDELHGIDLAPRGEVASTFEIRRANLALEPIPYPDNHFDSVSAYDFLEHVPRVLMTSDQLATRFPFIDLMNEVWRVLKPGGRFYASTPHFPWEHVFCDPTHVNYLTASTHDYFTRPLLFGQMYGFRGDFTMHRVLAVKPRHVYEPVAVTIGQRAIARLRRSNPFSRRSRSHLVWEFSANK